MSAPLGSGLKQREIEATLAPYAATIGNAPRSTIIPPRVDPDTAGRRAVEELAHRGTASETNVEGGLRLEGTLGTGGMGVVHLAVQKSVGRHVAVKSLRPDQVGEAAVLSLLQEAWITGALEHPNVLPVYDIALDASARPLIVLKRIEGDAWSELLRDPAKVRARFEEEPLIGHLQVLAQVCNAVRFAHSRGILHRDLKPENVMVGAFEEVYLLDWGIAVSLREDERGRLPLAADAHALAGTPAYMAPEMMAGDGGKLSERTDVYLLGAILFEILTGHAPHRFESLGKLVESAMRPPVLPPDVPEEIAAVCRRAMDPDPEKRFADAESMRTAIQAFLRHRGATRLLERAERALGTLRDEIENPGPDATAHRMRLYNLLTECRFGFREALASWPDNPAAKVGERAALLEMIEFELAVPDPAAAAALLGELDEPEPELRERVEAALAAAAAERRELARLREGARQLDSSIGQRTRVFVLSLLGIGWVAIPFIGHFNPEAYENSIMKIVWPLIFIVSMLLLAYWARDSLGKTAFNRRVVATILFLMGSEFLVAIVGHVIVGMDPTHTHMMHTLVAMVACGMLAIFTEPLLWYALAANAAALVVTAVWPEIRFLSTAGANAALSIALWQAWKPIEWGDRSKERAP